MSTAICTVNTDDGTISVSIDGETIDNPSYFSASRYKPYSYYSEDEDVSASYSVSKSERVNGVTKSVTICASEVDAGKLKGKLNSLVASVSSDPVEASINGFFDR